MPDIKAAELVQKKIEMNGKKIESNRNKIADFYKKLRNADSRSEQKLLDEVSKLRADNIKLLEETKKLEEKADKALQR